MIKLTLLLFIIPGIIFSQSIDTLIKDLGEPNKRLIAIEGIKKLGTLAVPSLIEVLEEKPLKILSTKEKEKIQRIKITSIILLGKTKDKRAKEPIINALKDKDKFVREASCLGLSYLKDPSTIPYLKALLKDKSGNVRMRAALALARLGNDAGKELAIKAINEDDITAQFLAGDVLEALKADDAIPILKSYIDNPNSLSWTRVHSLLAISKIEASKLKDEDRLEYLNNTLKTHQQLEVAKWAAQELANLILNQDPLSSKAREILENASSNYPYPGGYCAYKVLLRIKEGR